MTHPYSDPWHGQANITPAQMLTNRPLFRKQAYPGGMLAGGAASAGSPLSGTGEAIGQVLDSAGYGREPVVSDADPPTQSVESDGQDLYHVRHSANGSTVTHLGHDDLGSGDSD
jgi:hypothetical protein